MNNHKFEKMASTGLCKICYRPKLDEYHLEFLDKDDITTNVQPIRNHGINGEVKVYEKELTDKDKSESSNKPDCYGHNCPNCQDKWFHNYKCWPGTTENMHCPKCFGQSVVEIERDKNLKQIIAESENVLTSKQLVEMRLEHEAFLVIEFGRIEDFTERQTAVIEHINKMRGLCEKFSDHIRSARKYLKEFTEDEYSKLTPEEIEDFKRRSARQKKTNLASLQEENKKKWASELKDLIKIVGKDKAVKELTELWQDEGREVPNETN